MQPEIRYVRTSDGVRIAYATVGAGPPVMWITAPPFSHVQLEWTQPGGYLFFEPLAAAHTLIRFDQRGLGLSERDVPEHSLDAYVRDVEAVAERAAGDSFALIGSQHGAQIAVAYAVQHPDRVRRLILTDPFARGADFARLPIVGAMVELVRRDWEMFTENVAGIAYGYGREDTRRFGEFVRTAISPEDWLPMFESLTRIDMTDLLPQVHVPALVLHHADLGIVTSEMAHGVAAAIKDGRFVSLTGKWLDSTAEMTQAMLAFLAEDRPRGAPTPAPHRALSPREAEVAALVADGKTNREIAAILVLGERTVETHVANILGKLGFSNRAQIARWVTQSNAGPR
jgi:pimeloyl-ACP methyl ester carboxylesterase/DNA-binding CsgD family transcriptional regulator